MGGALDACGCSAELALRWYPIPGRRRALGVLARSTPRLGEWPPWPDLPSMAKLGHRGLLTCGPTLHCQPRRSLVTDRGCWAEGNRLRGSGLGATGPP